MCALIRGHFPIPSLCYDFLNLINFPYYRAQSPSAGISADGDPQSAFGGGLGILKLGRIGHPIEDRGVNPETYLWGRPPDLRSGGQGCVCLLSLVGLRHFGIIYLVEVTGDLYEH